MLVTDNVIRAVGSRVEVHLRPPLHDHLPAVAGQQRDRVRIGVDAEVVREHLERRLRLAHRHGGGRADAAARNAQHRGAVGQPHQFAATVQRRDGRLGQPGLHVGQRQGHVLLVLEIAGQLHQPLVTGTDLRRPQIEVDAGQPSIADLDGERDRRGLRKAVVGVDGHRRSARETGVGSEVERASITRHTHRAVGRTEDTDVERITLGVGDQTVHVPVQIEIDVGLARRGVDRRTGVGAIPQRSEQQLRVAGIQRAVAVEVGRPVVTAGAAQLGQQRGVGCIDLRVAVYVTGDKQFQRVLAGAAATDAQQVECRPIDTIERERSPVLDAARDRGVAQQLRQCRIESRSVGRRHDHAQQHGAAGSQHDLAVTRREAVEMLLARNERGAARRRQITEGGTQISRDRRHGHHVAVPDRLAGARAGCDGESMRLRLRVTVTQRTRRLEVAHRNEVAIDVVAVKERAPVRRRRLPQRSARVTHPAQRLVVRTGDPRIADREAHAVAKHDARDPALGGDLVARAVGSDQHVLRALGTECRRVVGLAGLQVVEAVGATLQLARERTQLPAAPGIVRNPGRCPVDEAAPLALLRREGEAEPLTVGCSEEQPCSGAQRVVHAARLGTGGRHVGFESHVAQGERPAEAEAAGVRRVQRIVAAREVQRVATHREREIGVAAQIATALRDGRDLDRGGRLGHAARDIARAKPQHVEPGLQTRRVERRQHTVDGLASFGEQHPVVAAGTRDLESPGIEIGVGDTPADRRHGTDTQAVQRRVEG
ncbi:MAG: hypothetical protein CALGDGBN_01925 [Pseudomonadales bacterium]|nr:hypothetical protein [Pseudomonadales bacterium]